MATNLDSKWNRILGYWNSAISASYKRWLKGDVTMLEAIWSGDSYLSSLESVCVVASKTGAAAAKGEHRKMSDWIKRVTKGFTKIS
jgi:hypothetical protein